MAEGISVGDAILKFLGDTSQLDATFASLPSKIESGTAPAVESLKNVGDAADDAGDSAKKAGDEVEEAGKRMGSSMRDARAEVGLLGEEMGIRLPRHVRSFVAELPGVGEALSAAFSATAVLFLIQALIEGTEKLSNFLANWLIFNSVMKEIQATLVASNMEVEKQAEAYRAAKEAVDTFGQSSLEKAKAKLTDLNKTLVDGAKEIEKWHEVVRAGVQATGEAYDTEGNAIAQMTDKDRAAYKVAEEKFLVLTQTNKAIAEQIELQKKVVAEEQKTADDKAHKERLAAIQRENEADTARVELFKRNEEAQNEADNARTELAKANEQERLKAIQLENEADTARTELYKKNVEAENEAENARWKMEQDRLKLEAEAEDARVKLYAAEKKALEDLKKQSEVTFQAFSAQWMKGASAVKQIGVESEEFFNKMTSGLQSTVAAALLSQESFGKAMEQMTRQALASLAAQAIVKALFYTAEGFAALVTNPAGAANYFTAAAEMAAVGAAAGGTARALGGSGGSSNHTGNNFGNNNSLSNTNSVGSGRGAVVGVQAFADGGLVTQPTLALIGEAGPEVVIPLNNQQPKGAMGGVGDTHNHFNVNINGLISDGDLTKVMKKMSTKVARGQGHLQSSSTLRISKRSA